MLSDGGLELEDMLPEQLQRPEIGYCNVYLLPQLEAFDRAAGNGRFPNLTSVCFEFWERDRQRDDLEIGTKTSLLKNLPRTTNRLRSKTEPTPPLCWSASSLFGERMKSGVTRGL